MSKQLKQEVEKLLEQNSLLKQRVKKLQEKLSVPRVFLLDPCQHEWNISAGYRHCPKCGEGD